MQQYRIAPAIEHEVNGNCRDEPRGTGCGGGRRHRRRGGPAGLGAALGAARGGARVLIVERNAFLGGTATAVQMATWNMIVNNMTGVASEIASRLIAEGGAVAGGPTTPFDPEAVKRLSLDLVAENGIQLLLYTQLVAPVLRDGRVLGVVVENKSGRQAILARTVIDCTGDADVAARAGASFVMGRESDSHMRPMTLLVRLGGLNLEKMVAYAIAHPEDFDPDPNFQLLDIDRGLLRFAGFYSQVETAHAAGELDPKIHYLRFEGIQVDKGVAFLNSVRVYDVDGTDAFDLTHAEIEGRHQAAQLVAFIKNRIPGCENSYVIDTSASMGVRETRRIVGRHVLTEEEIDADTMPSRTWWPRPGGFIRYVTDAQSGPCRGQCRGSLAPGAAPAAAFVPGAAGISGATGRRRTAGRRPLASPRRTPQTVGPGACTAAWSPARRPGSLRRWRHSRT